MKAKGKQIIAGLALAAVIGGCGLFLTAAPQVKRPCVQEYVAGQGNIKGDVDAEKYLEIDERLAVGADQDCWAVFKNPAAALNALEEKCPAGLKLIRKEYGLSPFISLDHESYKIYGWQVAAGTEEEREQARFVSQFMDIYENSFRA